MPSNHSNLERIVPPTPRACFAYWGYGALLVLPEGMRTVVFEYLTEPPRGDPQYRITIDGVTVGGLAGPVGFFGRDMHLSECSPFLAITSWHTEAWFHVIELVDCRYGSQRGLVKLAGVSARDVAFRPLQEERDALQSIRLADWPWDAIAKPLRRETKRAKRVR
jgi:hypothetical protein